MPRSTERTEASTKSLPRRRRIKRSHFRPDRSTHFDSRSKKAWTNSLTYSLTDKQVQPNFFSATHQWEFPDAKACYRMLLILQFWKTSPMREFSYFLFLWSQMEGGPMLYDTLFDLVMIDTLTYKAIFNFLSNVIRRYRTQGH